MKRPSLLCGQLHCDVCILRIREDFILGMEVEYLEHAGSSVATAAHKGWVW